jgi:hypothetical protein
MSWVRFGMTAATTGVLFGGGFAEALEAAGVGFGVAGAAAAVVSPPQAARVIRRAAAAHTCATPRLLRMALLIVA